MMNRNAKIVLGLLAFAALYLSLRAFWLNGDPGIPSVWEYGYNVTDEGYYLDGGKEKFLWGYFVDLPRMEAFSYGFSAGTHYLSYLAHLAFGLSTWAWRIPFAFLAFLAWIAAYLHIARKSGALESFLLCAAFSSVPMIVAYERTASNDVLIGSLTVMAYVLACGRAKGRLFAAAVVVSLIVLVKPSVWVLLPVVTAGVLATRKFRSPWIDLTVFVGTAVVCIFVCKFIVAWAVLPEASRAGVSMWEVVRRTTTHYPLPNIFDFASHFKGLSAFPRDPSYPLLGVCTVFTVVLPVALALKHIGQRTLSARTLLFLSVPAYVAAINVMNTLYTHYFIPVLMMLPIVVDAMNDDLTDSASKDERVFSLAKAVPVLVLILVASGIGLLYLSDLHGMSSVVRRYYSRVYNFPSLNVWGYTYEILIVFVVAMVGVILYLRGMKNWKWNLPVWTLASFVAASVVFAALPAVQLAPNVKQPSALYFVPMALMMVLSALMLVSVYGLPEIFRSRRLLVAVAVVAIAACYVLTPNWRQSACELMARPTFHHAEAAGELAKLLPKDAIVIGERSNQMLMSLPIRTVTTFPSNSDPDPIIKEIWKAEPQAQLYALADSRHSYNIQHYREHQKEYSLQVVKVFKMPSFGNGKPADVYFCKIDRVGSAE